MGACDSSGRRQHALGSGRTVEGNENPFRVNDARRRGGRLRDEHGATRQCEHLLHGAAEAPRHDTPFAVAAEDGQIDCEVPRERGDALGGVALFEPHVNRTSRKIGRSSLGLLEVLGCFAP